MKKAGKLVTGLLGLAMAVTTILPAMAAPSSVQSQKIELIENMAWVSAGAVTYDGDNYGGGRALCESVYPKSGSDNYKYIRYRITEYYGMVITAKAYERVEEGKGYKTIEIKRAYDHYQHIYFQFSGNSNSSAYAIVSYDGMGLPIVP